MPVISPLFDDNFLLLDHRMHDNIFFDGDNFIAKNSDICLSVLLKLKLWVRFRT